MLPLSRLILTVPLPATAFSWTLSVEGITFTQLGEISASSSVSGMGESGVVMTTLSCTTYSDTDYSNSVSLNAEVTLSCTSNPSLSPPTTFFVLSREVNGKKIKWTLGDRMCKAENYVEFAETDFTSGKISASTLITKAATACGFLGVSYVDSSALSVIGNVDRTACEGSTARDILDMMSQAMCGYFCAGATGYLTFVNLGCYANTTASVTQYAAISPGGTRSISTIMTVDGSDVYTSGNTIINQQTLVIDTQFASQALATCLAGALPASYSYNAWSCSRGKATTWITLGAISFNGTTRICTNLTLYPSGSGLYFSASANPVAERENGYQSSVQRQLNERIALERVNGNTAIGKQGLYFFENGYRTTQQSDPTAIVKYGFEVSTGGITEYDGAIIDRKTIKRATFNSDATQVQIAYDNKSYNINIEYDDDGNITDMTQEEVTD